MGLGSEIQHFDQLWVIHCLPSAAERRLCNRGRELHLFVYGCIFRMSLDILLV